MNQLMRSKFESKIKSNQYEKNNCGSYFCDIFQLYFGSWFTPHLNMIEIKISLGFS